MILLVIPQNAMFTIALLYANMSTSVCSCVQTSTDFFTFLQHRTDIYWHAEFFIFFLL